MKEILKAILLSIVPQVLKTLGSKIAEWFKPKPKV